MSARRILLTGCQGAGKTALVSEMARRGWDVVKSPAQRVIRAEQRMGGSGLPWQDAARFHRLCLKMAMADWEGVRVGTAIFDGGVIEPSLGLAATGAGASPKAAQKTYPYDRRVVLLPPWPALFSEGPDRRGSLDAAMEEYQMLTAGLTELGYALAVAPEAGIAARADWLEDALTSGAAQEV
ncbi:MAG: AAA family ATPase [Pseudomonadota bacterium]